MAGTNGRFFPVQAVHLGTSASFANTYSALGFDGTVASGQAGPWSGQLGMVVEDSGKCYRLVQFDNGTGDVAAVSGGAAHWKTRASYIVTSDQTDAQASLNSVAGAFLSVPTDQYYCWIQIGGVQTVTVNTTSTVGDALIATTTDLTLVATTTNTKGNQLIYAIVYASGTTTTSSVYWVFGNLL